MALTLTSAAKLANPNFGGIEELGRQIGSLKAMSDRRNMLSGMMDSPVDLADLAVSEAAQTGDATAVLQATQARDSVIKQRTQNSLSQLEANRLAASTPQEKMRIEKIMERVAAGAGIDARNITGRTQSEIDVAKSKQREAISSAYFGLDPDQTVKNAAGNEVSVIEQFEKNVEKAGFGAFLSKIKTERARNDKFNADIEAEEESLKKPLPIKSARDSLANLPAEIQRQLKKRLDDIKQPDFKAGGTWSSASERRQARDVLKLINAEILSYTIRQELDKASNIEALEKEIRKTEAIDPKRLAVGQAEAQKEAAIQELMAEEAFGTETEFFQGAPEKFGGKGFTKDVPLEPDLSNMGHVRRINQRAASLAGESNLALKSEELARLRLELSALQDNDVPLPEGFPQEVWSDMTPDQRRNVAGMTKEQQQAFINAGDK